MSRPQSRPAGWFTTLLGLIVLFGLTVLQPAQTCWASAAPAAEATSSDTHATAEKDIPGLIPEPNLATWSFFTFLLFFVLLSYFGWKPLREGLDLRERKIRGDIASAESNRVKAEQLLADYQKQLSQAQIEVGTLIAEARRDAEKMSQSIVADAQQKAEQERQRAVADIQRARDQALTEVFDAVVNNVFAATEKVVGLKLTDEQDHQLVRTAIEQLSRN